MNPFSVFSVGSVHCHIEGAMEKDDKPAFAKTRRMFQVSNWIADNAKLDVTCWTLPPPPAVPETAPSSDPGLWPAELKMTGEQGSQPAGKIFKNLKFFSRRATDLQASMLFISASELIARIVM